MAHFAQSIINKDFRLFDYGSKENLKKYKSSKPPLYPLKNISSKIFLYAGEFDQVFQRKDSDLLAAQLPNVKYQVISGYNHIDFLYARDVRDRLYKNVLQEFKAKRDDFNNN
jgi:pimeloyl-ACP methyl ester carboxylesterase